MLSSLPRIVLALAVLGLLGRAGRVAWSHRDLSLDVWRSIRPRHVLGGVGLLGLVLSVTVAASSLVPFLGRGLGDLFGTAGNAVFAPVDVAAQATGAGTTVGFGGGDLLYLVAITLFLGLLAALLPWFAFVEEEVFRAGAEAWSLPRRIAAATWFGMAHLVMLVPLAAALGIGAAGFAYGEVYRRGVADEATPAPASVRSAFRATKRSRAAIRMQAPDPVDAAEHAQRQMAGVHRSTVWHATFNTLVVVLVWSTLALEVLVPAPG